MPRESHTGGDLGLNFPLWLTVRTSFRKLSPGCTLKRLFFFFLEVLLTESEGVLSCAASGLYCPSAGAASGEVGSLECSDCAMLLLSSVEGKANEMVVADCLRGDGRGS